MSRIDTSHWRTKAKHEHTIIALSDVVYKLRTCLKANVPIDPTTRQDCIWAIDAARRDIERCRTNIDDMLKGDGSPNLRTPSDFYMMDHINCVSLLTELNMALKLGKIYDMTLLDNLEAEINKLEDCREDMRMYRHVRGQGYVR